MSADLPCPICRSSFRDTAIQTMALLHRQKEQQIASRQRRPLAHVSVNPLPSIAAEKGFSMTPRNGLDSLLRPEDSVLVLIDHQPYQLTNVNSHEPQMVVNNA